MDPEVGKLVVIGITAGGAVAWLAGLAAMVRAEREWSESYREAAERFDAEGDTNPGTIVGQAEVDGRPDELTTKLAGLLARDGMGPFAPIKIVASDCNQLEFVSAGPSQPPFRGGRLRLSPDGSRTRIDYAIRAGSRGLLIGGWAMVGLGLVALVAAPVLAFGFLLPSPNPNVRTQAFQVVQMVHVLWPPFLFAHLSRQPARMFRARIEALVNNLPYT